MIFYALNFRIPVSQFHNVHEKYQININNLLCELYGMEDIYYWNTNKSKRKKITLFN